MGLDAKGLGVGDRPSKQQTKMKNELVRLMGHKKPDPRDESMWDPVASAWFPEGFMVAARLFPWKGGQDLMHGVFGETEDGKSELFSPMNGMLWSSDTEYRFSQGLFVIVPDLADQSSEKEVEEWEAKDTKNYKISVLHKTRAPMTKFIYGTERLWADLDNELVTFKTSFRPRARYLYYTYCTAMLQMSWHIGIKEAQGHQLQQRFWGTRGQYMQRNMLQALVDEMGNTYDDLLEGAMDGKGNEEPGEMVLALANSQIANSMRSEEEIADGKKRQRWGRTMKRTRKKEEVR